MHHSTQQLVRHVQFHFRLVDMQKLLRRPPPKRDIDRIYLCFKWLFILLFYAGCLSFRLKGDELSLTTATVVYTHFIRIALVIGFIGGIVLKLTNEESADAMLGPLSPVLKFVLVFEGFICTLTYIQISLVMESHKHAHLKLARSFQTLDRRMQTDFPTISWNYYKSVRKYTPLTIFVVGFYVVVALLYLYNTANCTCDPFTTLVAAISYAWMTAAPGCASFLQIGATDMLRLRFRLIRRMLAQHFAARQSYKNQLELHLRIGRLIGYCKSYIELVLAVNSVYGHICATSLFYDFSILTNMFFLLCQKASESRAPAKDYVFIMLFMAPRLYKVIITAAYGHMAHRERRNCIQMVLDYGDYFPNCPKVRDTLQSFIHWKMHHSYHLTIGRMIRCNLIILHLAIHGIANYVIILIQLQFQQNNITNRLNSHGIPQDVELVGTNIKILKRN